MSHRSFHREVLDGLGLLDGHSRIESACMQGFSGHLKLAAAKAFMSYHGVVHHVRILLGRHLLSWLPLTLLNGLKLSIFAIKYIDALGICSEKDLLGKLVYFSQLIELFAYRELAACIPKRVYIHCTCYY